MFAYGELAWKASKIEDSLEMLVSRFDFISFFFFFSSVFLFNFWFINRGLGGMQLTENLVWISGKFTGRSNRGALSVDCMENDGNI